MNGPGLQHARHFWLPLAILAGLVVATAWIGQLARAPQARGEAAFGHHPDYFAEDLNAVAFDQDGQPRYRLSAVRMTHYMDDDTTELTAPRFVREGAEMARVVVRSLRGLVSPEGESVYFLGDVRMLHERLHDGAPMELASEYLRVIPDQDLIRTDKPVTLSDGRNRLYGTAMVADGRQGTLVLKGRVKGIYEKHR